MPASWIRRHAAGLAYQERARPMHAIMAPGVSARFGIRGIPTMILFKGGQPVDQIVGLVSKDEIKKMVAGHI